MNTRLTAALIMATFASLAATTLAAPVGTAFTYQGQLKNAVGPVSGLHDLRFRLYDALTLGTPVGAVVCIDDVNVIAGLFTVSLDFGAQFAGQERFLEIEVRTDTGLDCAIPTGFAVLTPRQALTAVPHALLALNATIATTATSATSATTATNATQLGGQPAAFYQNASNQTSGTLNNLRLPMPLTLSGASVSSHIIRSENTSTGHFSSAIHGLALGASGVTYGGRFESESTDGIGVRADANAISGNTIGVYGVTQSQTGRGVWGHAGPAIGATTGVYGTVNSTTGIGVAGLAGASSGFTYGGRFESNSPSGRGVFGLATADNGLTRGVWGQSASSDGRGVLGEAISPTGATQGVRGLSISNSDNAVGVFGLASANSGFTFGGRFESISTSGIGVFGFSTPASGVTTGVYGRADSTSGRGVFGIAPAGSGGTFGVYGQSDSPFGLGVYGVATASSGGSFGVYGQSNSTSGYGVFGFSTATGGTTTGVYGRSDSISGTGVYGIAASSVPGRGIGVHGVSYSDSIDLENGGVVGESFGTGGTGVLGRAHVGEAFSSGVGVWGVSTIANAYAGYFTGSVHVAGLLSKSAGSFKIDHPMDPTNKYLVHSFVESPDMMIIYNGNIVTDSNGMADVQLPDYFESLNREFRYQLTVIGQFAQAIVAEEINGNRFAIRTNKPGVKVSWQVTGVRQDPWAEAHRIEVEPTKSADARGKYLNPELYGKADELGEMRSMAAARVGEAKKELHKREHPELHANPREIVPNEAPAAALQGPEKGTYQHPDLDNQPPEKDMSYDAHSDNSQSAGNEPVSAALTP